MRFYYVQSQFIMKSGYVSLPHVWRKWKKNNIGLLTMLPSSTLSLSFCFLSVSLVLQPPLSLFLFLSLPLISFSPSFPLSSLPPFFPSPLSVSLSAFPLSLPQNISIRETESYWFIRLEKVILPVAGIVSLGGKIFVQIQLVRSRGSCWTAEDECVRLRVG